LPRDEVTISLSSIDRETYAIGDSMVYEVLIRNTGAQPLTVPWSRTFNSLWMTYCLRRFSAQVSF